MTESAHAVDAGCVKPAPTSTRRAAVRRALWLGCAAVATGIVRPRAASAGDTSGDAKILEAAVGLEQTVAVAYGVALDSGQLDDRNERLVRLLRDQEREHVDVLSRALEKLDGTPPRPPTPREIEGLVRLRNQDELLRFAIELETMALAAYYDAHQKLQDGRLLQTAASIMSSAGQHLVLLRQALGHNPVPHAFETGED